MGPKVRYIDKGKGAANEQVCYIDEQVNEHHGKKSQKGTETLHHSILAQGINIPGIRICSLARV
jgi:hypothetical protein